MSSYQKIDKTEIDNHQTNSTDTFMLFGLVNI